MFFCFFKKIQFQFNPISLFFQLFAGLTATPVVFGFLRSLLFFHVLVRSAQNLHDSMFSAILRTPVRFFDVNPIGECLPLFFFIFMYLFFLKEKSLAY